jgi:glutathione-independent formaldehyde dehydrogenase
VSPGDTVAVFGAGPVGLLAVHSAFLRGAARVFAVDMQPDRLNLAEQFGADAIRASNGGPAEQILEATGGLGADCGVDAVGYQAHDPAGDEHPETVLDWLVSSVRSTGRLGVIGVYLPQDPGAATDEAKKGRIGFDFGRLFQKGLSLGTGQCPVKRYNEQLRDLIIAGRATPSRIVSHELPLTEAPSAYDKFDKRVDGYTKVLLHPAA